MSAPRNEFRTGLFVVLTIGVLVLAILYLGVPGVFVSQKTFYIFFDNAAGIRPGARVLVAGRKVGTVARIRAPVEEADRPEPKYESLVEVHLAADTKVYKKVNVVMLQLTMLADMVIDFAEGEEASGLAPDGAYFIGSRQPGLSEAVPLVLEKIDPAIRKSVETMEALHKTVGNIDRLTEKGADLPEAFAEFRKFGADLNELTEADGPLRNSVRNLERLTDENGPLAKTLRNAEALTGPEGDLAKTLRNAQEFTDRLARNRDLEATFLNSRRASEKLEQTVHSLSPRVSVIGNNLEQATDTIKRQPWRLFWPTTKKYPAEKKPESQWISRRKTSRSD